LKICAKRHMNERSAARETSSTQNLNWGCKANWLEGSTAAKPLTTDRAQFRIYVKCQIFEWFTLTETLDGDEFDSDWKWNGRE
jgi:hypothetical protein